MSGQAASTAVYVTGMSRLAWLVSSTVKPIPIRSRSSRAFLARFTALAGTTVKIVDEHAKTFLSPVIKLSSQPKDTSASDGKLYVVTESGVAVYTNGQLLKETDVGFTPGTITASGSLVAVGTDKNSVTIFKTDSSGTLNHVQTLTTLPAPFPPFRFLGTGHIWLLETVLARSTSSKQVHGH